MSTLALGARVRKTLTVHSGQRKVIDDRHRFKVIVAGRRWGKTQSAKSAIIKASKKPRRLIWYVAPTYRMARGIMWLELLESIPRGLIAKADETLMIITLVNKTRIECKGADKPDTLRGVGLHLVVIDEAQNIREDTWYKILRPTLASTRGEALIIGTPKSFNWLYDVYMLGQRGDTFHDPKRRVHVVNPWKSWQFPTITSPFIPPEEIVAARHDLDEKSFRQEFEASFESMSGRVYHAFDRNIHLGNYAFNPKLPIWVGQDFNIDPMTSVIMQPQENGEIWIVNESVIFGSNTQEASDKLGELLFRQMKSVTVYPDPAGTQRGHQHGESDFDIMREAGFIRLKYRRKAPKVADRVNAVNRMFKSADGTIRMRIDHSCKHTITAFEQVIYKPGTRDVDKTMNIEHAADAVGYAMDIEFPVRKVEMAGYSR
jgi:hypothetical protein